MAGISKSFSGVITAAMLAIMVLPATAGPLEQAKRIHDRLTGVPASEAVLLQMSAAIGEGDGMAAAEIAMRNDNFYRVTLKTWAAPWSNREQTPFVPLNDYIATVMGLVRDGEDFRKLLWDDVVYTAQGVTPSYSTEDNRHYVALEQGRDGDGRALNYQNLLQRQLQSMVTGLPAEATAGVMTSRAAAKAFFIAGTNRAQLRFTLLNHLCRDLEQVHDVTRVPDRIRQDVSRSPGGDARAFLNGCLGCHAGMDPLAQAFAYYDYDYEPATDLTGESGRIEYHSAADVHPLTGTRVQGKYHINSATFSPGYVTVDDRWDNYWREGINSQLGWDMSLPGHGYGAKSLGRELAHSQAFAACQVHKVFKAVCLREPEDGADRQQIQSMTNQFADDSFRLKTVFAAAADYCKGA